MTVQIRIVTAPPSRPAPPEVRQAWVGLEMPAVADNGDGVWSGADNKGGFVVSKVDAIEALLGARQQAAADFWLALPPIEKFRFAEDCCEVIGT